jgi:uncharacterized protein (TIGR02118 family)
LTHFSIYALWRFKYTTYEGQSVIKLVLMVKRKAGLDRAAFRTHYETIHAPLAASLMQHCVRYKRNFVVDEPMGDQGFDVITEFWFDHAGDRWADVRHQFANAEVAGILAEDEARFMDRDTMRIVVVDEAETASGLLLGNA